MSSTGEKIRIVDLHAYYGESHILHGIDMSIMQGELVTLLDINFINVATSQTGKNQ